MVFAVNSAILARAPVLRSFNVADADLIENEYIVKFDKDIVTSFEAGMSAAKALGLSPSHVYDFGGFRGFAAKMDDAQLIAVSDIAGVEYIEVNSRVYAYEQYPECGTTAQHDSWGLGRVSSVEWDSSSDVRHFNRAGGEGVSAYILDTGIRCGHNDFAKCENIFCDTTLVTHTCAGEEQPGLNIDENGHGTHVAGTVAGQEYGVAPGAQLYGLKVLGDLLGAGSIAGIVAGIAFATGHNNGGNGVANMSLGGGRSDALNDAVEAAFREGLIVAAASGNGGSANGACNNSPAMSPFAVTVGATDINDRLAAFTDQGDCVDVLAPGANIKAPWWTDDSATNTISGTSMACPHAAGGLALLRGENPQLDASAVVDRFLNATISDAISGVNAATPNLLMQTC